MLGPEQVLDELLRRATTAASPANCASTPRSPLCKSLPLRLEATRHYWTNKVRSVEQIEPALRAEIRRLVKGELPWPLVLLGPPGLGKSCAALTLLDHAGGFYYTAEDLAREMIVSQHGRLRTPNGMQVHPEQLWLELGRARLVVIDDLGIGATSRGGMNGAAVSVSDHHYGCVKKVLDVREALPLVVIANLDLDQLASLYDARVSSRLAAGTVFSLQGPDRRLQDRRTAPEVAREPRKG